MDVSVFYLGGSDEEALTLAFILVSFALASLSSQS